MRDSSGTEAKNALYETLAKADKPKNTYYHFGEDDCLRRLLRRYSG